MVKKIRIKRYVKNGKVMRPRAKNINEIDKKIHYRESRWYYLLILIGFIIILYFKFNYTLMPFMIIIYAFLIFQNESKPTQNTRQKEKSENA